MLPSITWGADLSNTKEDILVKKLGKRNTRAENLKPQFCYVVEKLMHDSISPSYWTHGSNMVVDWDYLPFSVRPDGGGLPQSRSWRKMIQVENMIHISAKLITHRLRQCSQTISVVEFCAGSGYIALPLAAMFPSVNFILVDMKVSPIGTTVFFHIGFEIHWFECHSITCPSRDHWTSQKRESKKPICETLLWLKEELKLSTILLTLGSPCMLVGLQQILQWASKNIIFYCILHLHCWSDEHWENIYHHSFNTSVIRSYKFIVGYTSLFRCLEKRAAFVLCSCCIGKILLTTKQPRSLTFASSLTEVRECVHVGCDSYIMTHVHVPFNDEAWRRNTTLSFIPMRGRIWLFKYM